MTKFRWQEFPGAENIAQPGAAAAEARLHRPEIGAGDRGDLLVGQALEIAEDHNDALVVGQLGQPLLDGAGQFVAQRGFIGRFAGIGEVGQGTALARVGGVEGQSGPAFTGAQGIVAGVGGDAQQPGAEHAAAKAGEVAVGGDEGFLGDISGGVGVAEHAVAEVVDPRFIQPHELVERLDISPLPGFDEARFFTGHSAATLPLCSLPGFIIAEAARRARGVLRGHNTLGGAGRRGATPDGAVSAPWWTSGGAPALRFDPEQRVQWRRELDRLKMVLWSGVWGNQVSPHPRPREGSDGLCIHNPL